MPADMKQFMALKAILGFPRPGYYLEAQERYIIRGIKWYAAILVREMGGRERDLEHQDKESELAVSPREMLSNRTHGLFGVKYAGHRVSGLESLKEVLLTLISLPTALKPQHLSKQRLLKVLLRECHRQEIQRDLKVQPPPSTLQRTRRKLKVPLQLCKLLKTQRSLRQLLPWSS